MFSEYHPWRHYHKTSQGQNKFCSVVIFVALFLSVNFYLHIPTHKLIIQQN